MAPMTMASMKAATRVAVLLILGSSFQTGTAAVLGLRSATSSNSTLRSTLGAIREAYTTNAICGKKNCINPIFPAMEDLHHLAQSKWICSSLQKTSPSMGFCRNAVTYDPALPLPAGGSASVKALVQRQDNAASTAFYYHLTGLGLEAWDYQKPEFADDCIKSIWRMVCFTYFPRAEVGCQDGAWSNYIRPCQSSCMNYVRTCGVECCDESVQCVFTHSKAISAKQTVTTEGYAPHDGPSSLCTGAAQRTSKRLSTMFWIIVVIAMAISLQGCDYDVPVHSVGNWRGQPDYLIKHEFVPPGGSAKDANLNSCSLQRLSQTLQCSGRGVCKLWDPNNFENSLSFCECDRDWTDPECRTRRKSQTIAYLLAMFFGFLGLDQFYLGFIGMGLVKLFTFGGFGVLWVTDMIKVGSAPVYSSDYRTAADLPHYGFVLTATMFAVFMGFAVAYVLTVNFRRDKRRSAMLLQGDEEARQAGQSKLFTDAYKPGDPKNVEGRGRPVLDGINQEPPDMSRPPDYGTMSQMPPATTMGPPGMGQTMSQMPVTTMPPSSMMGQTMNMGNMGQSMNMGPPPSTMGPMPGSMNMGPPPPPMGSSMNMPTMPVGQMPGTMPMVPPTTSMPTMPVGSMPMGGSMNPFGPASIGSMSMARP